MRPPDPIPEPTPSADVPLAIGEAIDALARLRARVGTADGPTGTAREPGAPDGPAAADAIGAVGASRERDREWGARTAEAAALVALRHAVERYARDLRSQGVPPERMIVAVKSVVRRATTAQPLPEPEHLIPDLVQWSIAAYFAAD